MLLLRFFLSNTILNYNNLLFLCQWVDFLEMNGIILAMKEIVIFIVIIIIALVVLFAFEGKNLSGANILSAFRFDFKSPAPAPAPTPAPAPKPLQPESQETQPTQPSENISPENPKALSLYYQKIKISGVTKKNTYHPSVIRLRVSTKEKINITGFTIKTRHGEFKIPQGIEKYQSDKPEKDITTQGYLTIYLIGDISPLNTSAFRINSCLGYLKESNQFYPSFSSYCPKPELEDIYNLHPYCQDYILDLKRCQIPDYSSNLKIATNSFCTSYIAENLNYSGCYRNYQKEDDFLKNYWYIYTKSDLVEPLHDIIYLYDQNGFLVDDYTY